MAAALLTLALSPSALAQTRHPDLQGVWTNGTLTPFERPANMADKAFLTEAEAADIERRSAERRAATERRQATLGPVGADVGGDNEAFVDSGNKVTVTRQTSLIVDPPDGRIPFRAGVEARRDFNLNSMDTFETMSPWDRCITRSPTVLLPAGYNNGYQIVQTRDTVVIVAEMVHEARIVRIGGTHLPAAVQSWLGDSVGHWEGETLVVDTTNFNDRGWIATHAATGRLRGTPYTSKLHLIERFTPKDHDTLIYALTVEDPEIYTRPWTVQVPFTRDDSYRMFEYACHEGNQAIENFLRGARAEEKSNQDRQ